MYGSSYILYALIITVGAQYNGTYTGILSPDCVKNYNRIFVTRNVPPRNYQYFHEARSNDYRQGSGDVELGFRIVGGKQVSIEQVPYTVLYGLYCGGSIIAPDWVITAAHCRDKETFVIAGSSQRSLGKRYPICSHFIHPLWDASDAHNHDYDYQLVLLEIPIPVTPRSRPIAIGDIGDYRPGEMVALSGWGHIRHKEKMQEFIRRVFVPIIDSDVCRRFPNKEYHNISPRMFCAGFLNGTKDSCQGDSGGPAVGSNGKLLGLVSFGVGCAVAYQPGVYSNIAMARDWIRYVTALPL